MEKQGIYSIYIHDENNRYVLGNKGEKTLYVIGLNPSTATDKKSDRTIDRIKKDFAKGFDSFIMLNLYPKVTPSPSKLPNNNEYDETAFSRNIAEIGKHVPENATILAVWGNNIDCRNYLKTSLLEISKQLNRKNCKWVKIGELTKVGNPRHPLYARSDWKLSEYKINDKIEKLKQIN
ncbi:MAG: DUF1643 domain-containing protein [Prevotellaceae bacterium]|jgi:serine/threonine protein phosphatase 1|nr:DUF1643 domain-containing protein [Prevotellaceae bacterium]